MSDYQLTATDVVIRTTDNAYIPLDPANRDRAVYEAWKDAGGVPDPYVLPISDTPRSCTPRQARLALLHANLLDQVEALVAATGGVTKITWEYASVFERGDPMLSAIASSLNLTDAQIDDLFVYAVTQ